MFCSTVGLFDYFVAGSNNQVSSVIINISSSSCNNVIIGVDCSLSLRCLLTWPIARRAQKATLFLALGKRRSLFAFSIACFCFIRDVAVKRERERVNK